MRSTAVLLHITGWSTDVGTEAQPSRDDPCACTFWIEHLMNSAALKSFVKNRHLFWSMAVREVQGRYRGSFAGVIWSFVTPLIMLTVYTFVFSYVFQPRWGTGAAGIAFPLSCAIRCL